jgi:3-oxoacyl-[acyl-carrier protein] reductase
MATQTPENSAAPVRPLDGRVAIVTGAGQGIGRAFAQTFTSAGAAVIVADKDGGRAETVASALVDDQHSAMAVEVDVSDAESVSRMVTSTLQSFDRIDILVNNAAIFSTITMRPFEEIPLSEWDQVIAVNLTGAFLCCRSVSGQMRQQQYGRIINLSSGTVLSGRPNYLHYVTSKAGIVGMTRSMARELGPSGITVNAIMPGSVGTEIVRETVTPEQIAQIIAGQAVQRRLVPEDITAAAVFLASESAGAISGQTVVVDGGHDFV